MGRGVGVGVGEGTDLDQAPFPELPSLLPPVGGAALCRRSPQRDVLPEVTPGSVLCPARRRTPFFSSSIFPISNFIRTFTFVYGAQKYSYSHRTEGSGGRTHMCLNACS